MNQKKTHGNLVLTRRVGERLWIGEGVCVDVIEVSRGRVKVSIRAPLDVTVERDELLGPGESAARVAAAGGR